MGVADRQGRLRSRMQTEGLDGLLITNLTNIRYLTGFAGTNGYVLVTSDATRFVTDGRYATQASQMVKEAEITICTTHAAVVELLNSLARQHHLERVGYEATHVTVASRGAAWEPPPGLDKVMGYFEGAELVATQGWVEELRKVKDAEEIASIRAAAQMGDAGFEYILERVKPGVTERELALDLEFHLRSLGSEGVSFDPIVAAAERSALPHARPSDRTVERGHYLLFDFGCVVEGYCSDMTRTVVVGSVDDRHREVYQTVLESQIAGLEAAGPGVACGDVDKVARKVIERAGYPEAFMHGLGHGVGLEIHEAPSLKTGFPEQLAPGHVITVEPGAYFEGWGGVRVEDLAVVTETGLEVLSNAPKDLIVL
ncbi:MAG TPA: Xaa-Pro peptidase family protein [Actinomycetota bacterium]|nr:Xaa-Pro peptidase family protein [Actinomycetota bacterium]